VTFPGARSRIILTALCCAVLISCKNGDQGLISSPAVDAPAAHWTAYGGDNAAKYSPLEDIKPTNVSELEVAWTHNSGDFLYPAVCRGVSLWQDPDASGRSCATRIIYGTRDAELIALDADSGKPCPDFGDSGRVQLREGISGARPFEYYPTSPPFIIGDIAVVGALVPDNERVDVPSGVVRAFNVRTGALVWAWEPVSEDYKRRHRDSLGNALYHLGSPNVWAPISGDPELGLVYIPTGNPSPDLYGGQRDGIDFYGSSTVAVDAATGEVRWHFQSVHHDIWDYDVASQPSLFDIPGVGGSRPGLAQATKMGHIFLLDRETGEPLYPVEERPVPQGAVPGESPSATQPFPTHPAPLHLPAKLTDDDMDGFVYFDRRGCQRELAKYRSDGMFTPPSLEGTVVYPSNIGGINWGGITIDPVQGILYANQMHLASVVQLIPRATYDDLNPQTHYPLEHYPMTGTAYGVKRFPLTSPLTGAPCNPRPWGSLSAVDLRSGELLWQRPLGTTRGLAPWPLWFEAGAPNIGGSLATGGGLLFIGASADGFFRAFDSRSGEELWRHKMPYTANATPISYRTHRGGRQFIVVAAGGHGWSSPGDAIVAFALPER
jgi:quinoprotein glucose dehydrogenase